MAFGKMRVCGDAGEKTGKTQIQVYFDFNADLIGNGSVPICM